MVSQPGGALNVGTAEDTEVVRTWQVAPTEKTEGARFGAVSPYNPDSQRERRPE